jgi:diguanylate cyclase (GGDEF)-like protein
MPQGFDIIAALAENACLLVGLALAQAGLGGLTSEWQPRAGAAATGLLFGVASLATMLVPVQWSAGIFFDVRAVPVALAGPAGGAIAAIGAVLPPLGYRLWAGGPGAISGASLLVGAAALGCVLARLRGPAHGGAPAGLHWHQVGAAAGLLPPLGIVSLLLLPDHGLRAPIVAAVAPAFLLVLPVATLALGGLLVLDGRRRALARQVAAQDRERHLLLENVPGVLFRRRRAPDGTASYPLLAGQVEAVLAVAPEAVAADPRSAFLAIHPEDRLRLRAAFEAALDGGPPVALDVRLVPQGGVGRWLHVAATPVAGLPAGAAPEWHGFVTDVTARKQAEIALAAARDSLAAAAGTDALTGLANRRALDERLLAEWRRAAREGLPLSVVLADVDRFKALNDQLGHPAGDACLIALGETLACAARRAGDFVARFGGEEFAVVLPATGAAGARATAEQQRAAVEERALPHPDGGGVTASFGVATARPAAAADAAAGIAALLAAADAALYRAKRAGRNRVADAAPQLLSVA